MLLRCRQPLRAGGGDGGQLLKATVGLPCKQRDGLGGCVLLRGKQPLVVCCTMVQLRVDVARVGRHFDKGRARFVGVRVQTSCPGMNQDWRTGGDGLVVVMVISCSRPAARDPRSQQGAPLPAAGGRARAGAAHASEGQVPKPKCACGGLHYGAGATVLVGRGCIFCPGWALDLTLPEFA